MLTIDSAIEVIRHPGEPRELNDAPTKTGNARTMTLDPDKLNAIWELRREREPYGPWMFGVGPIWFRRITSVGGGREHARTLAST